MHDANDQKMPPPEVTTASGCQIQGTAWVLQFVFMETITEQGQAREVPRLKVGIPWPLAKVVAQVLQSTINAYEAQEGEIAVPKSVAAQLPAMIEKFAPKAG